jgi:hypothetical protein
MEMLCLMLPKVCHFRGGGGGPIRHVEDFQSSQSIHKALKPTLNPKPHMLCGEGLLRSHSCALEGCKHTQAGAQSQMCLGHCRFVVRNYNLQQSVLRMSTLKYRDSIYGQECLQLHLITIKFVSIAPKELSAFLVDLPPFFTKAGHF